VLIPQRIKCCKINYQMSPFIKRIVLCNLQLFVYFYLFTGASKLYPGRVILNVSLILNPKTSPRKKSLSKIQVKNNNSWLRCPSHSQLFGVLVGFLAYNQMKEIVFCEYLHDSANYLLAIDHSGPNFILQN